MTTRANRLGESLDRAYRHWRERGVLETSEDHHEAAPRMTIAVSRERGAGGGSVARMLSQRLDWPLYDRELMEHISKKSGIQQDLLTELDESRPTWFSEIIKSLGTERQMTAAGYAALLHKLVAALYMRGNCIVLGRGAAQILPADHTLRVRLIAPHEHRVDRVAEQFANRNEAIKHVKQVDHDRAIFVKEYFHKDVNNSHDYDLTIDTSRFDLIACCELIERALVARMAVVQHAEA